MLFITTTFKMAFLAGTEVDVRFETVTLEQVKMLINLAPAIQVEADSVGCLAIGREFEIVNSFKLQGDDTIMLIVLDGSFWLAAAE